MLPAGRGVNMAPTPGRSRFCGVGDMAGGCVDPGQSIACFEQRRIRRQAVLGRVDEVSPDCGDLKRRGLPDCEEDNRDFSQGCGAPRQDRRLR